MPSRSEHETHLEVGPIDLNLGIGRFTGSGMAMGLINLQTPNTVNVSPSFMNSDLNPSTPELKLLPAKTSRKEIKHHKQIEIKELRLQQDCLQSPTSKASNLL